MANLAINGGSPVRTKPWPIWPMMGEQELVQLKEVLAAVDGTDRLWSGLLPCPKATELEHRFAAYQGCRYGIALATGAAALEIALYAIGLEVGDEVITTPLTWVASASCILRAGGVPIFVDVEPHTYAMDPDLLHEAITPRTKAILPVHLAGYPAQIDKIVEIADEHGLFVIEDCAQAHGSLYHGKPVGSFGQLGCFSFQSSKFMASGEGGMILTNDQDLWQRCHSYKDCGRLRGDAGYVDSKTAYEQGQWGFGLNYRLTEFQAAVLLAQLERMEEHKAQRMTNARSLYDALDDMDGLTPLELQEGQNTWRFIVNYASDAFDGLSLGRFIEAVRAEGIPLRHFPLYPLPKEGLYCGYLQLLAGSPGLAANPKDYGAVHLPVAERAHSENIVYLQQNVLLGDATDMEDIVIAIDKVLTFRAELG
jgi:dTDP-4-amino-4,6-dideoxygalactose transaminase